MNYKSINDLDEGEKNKLIGCLSLIIFSSIRTGNLTKKQKEIIKEIRLVRIEGGNRQIRKFSIDESFLAGFDYEIEETNCPEFGRPPKEKFIDKCYNEKYEYNTAQEGLYWKEYKLV